MANRPPITAAIDLTPEVLNALKQAGPNERGKYSLDMAVWENTKSTSDRAPGFTGSVKLKGDKGDGIPNILSPSDCFVLDKRQTPITKGKLDKFLSEHYSNYESVANTGFTRNQLLIDLSLIPGDIKEKIINTYEETKPAPRSKLLNYFIENRLKNLMDVIEEF